MARNFNKKMAKDILEPQKSKKKVSKKKEIKEEPITGSVEEILDKTLSYKNTIKILEARNNQLQEMLNNMTDKDRPYAHNKGTKYQTFGRTKEQYDELIKISRHLVNTNKRLTNAIEKIENYPIKTRDKIILALEVLTSKLDEERRYQ